MSQTHETRPGAGPDGGQGQAPWRLTRSSDDKIVSGLCGGLGRHFGLDPVVFRIAFVVLALAGGGGFMLYLVGWALIPDDRTGATGLDHIRHGRGHQIAAAVLLGAAAVLFLDRVANDRSADVPIGLVLLGVGAAVLWSQRQGGEPLDRPGPSDRPEPPGGPSPTEPEGSGPDERDVATSSTAPPPGGPAPPPRRPETQPAGPPPPLPPLPRATPRSPSALVPVTLSLLAILGGLLALLDAAGTVHASLPVGLALALVVTGGGLLVGAWWGRARLLLPVGVVLSVALLAASAVNVPLAGGIGDRSYRPATLAALHSPYRLAVGDMEVDLDELDISGTTTTVVTSLGVGDLTVVVPQGPEVVVDAGAGAGEVRVFDRTWEGFGVRGRLTQPGREGGGRLVLRTRVGVGELEVRRGPA